MILATLSKLKQVCNHPAQFLGDNSPLPGRSGKLARLTEMLEEVLEAGDRALVFTQFAEMGAMLQAPPRRRPSAARSSSSTAASPKAQRDRMVERFQKDEDGAADLPALAQGGRHRPEPDRAPTTCSTSTAGGTPPSRTRPPTAPSASARRATCRSTSSSASGTLEEKIDEMIEKKKAVAEQVVGTGEGWLTELSTAELRELMTLRAGAVAE